MAQCRSFCRTLFKEEWVPALPESLCCVLGQDSLLSPCLSTYPPSFINGYAQDEKNNGYSIVEMQGQMRVSIKYT